MVKSSELRNPSITEHDVRLPVIWVVHSTMANPSDTLPVCLQVFNRNANDVIYNAFLDLMNCLKEKKETARKQNNCSIMTRRLTRQGERSLKLLFLFVGQCARKNQRINGNIDDHKK